MTPEPDNDPLILVEDLAREGHCVAGQKRFCDAHNIDFKDYVRNGIRASRLLATGDAMVISVVTKKMIEMSDRGRQ